MRTTCVVAVFATDERVFEMPGVAVHLLDVLEQSLCFAPHRDALSAAIEQFHRQQGFKAANPPADRRVVQPQPFGRRMDAAMPGNLEEHFQIVPFRDVRIHRRRLCLKSAGSLQQMSTGWCKITP